MDKINTIYNCKDFHESCKELFLQKLLITLKYAAKLHIVYTIVPAIIFKRKEFIENFVGTFKATIIKFMRSIFYFTGYLLITRLSQCIISNLFGTFNISFAIFISVINSLAVLVEDNNKIKEYTIFTLPKSFESLYMLGCKRGFFNEVKYSLSLLYASSIALMLWLKDNNEIDKKYESLFDFFIY